MTTNKQFVEILRALPENKLAIIELTWQLAKKDGEIDYDKSIQMTNEIGTAEKQAEQYTRGVAGVKACLKKLFQS